MSLIRSEHVNERAVQQAKDDLAEAERALEEARARLEKKERKQYHEEQIWSDTIRRNSTWVTFGLMGANILLLLGNLAVIEPWRRRRLVREVRAALEEKTIATPAVASVEKEVDGVVEPVGVSMEKLMEAPSVEKAPTASGTVLDPVSRDHAAGRTPVVAGELLPEEAVEIVNTNPATAQSRSPEIEGASRHCTTEQSKLWDRTVRASLHSWQESKRILADLFSERSVTLKQVDVTAIALEGAAAGVIVMGLFFALLRPN